MIFDGLILEEKQTTSPSYQVDQDALGYQVDKSLDTKYQNKSVSRYAWHHVQRNYLYMFLYETILYQIRSTEHPSCTLKVGKIKLLRWHY